MVCCLDALAHRSRSPFFVSYRSCRVLRDRSYCSANMVYSFMYGLSMSTTGPMHESTFHDAPPSFVNSSRRILLQRANDSQVLKTVLTSVLVRGELFGSLNGRMYARTTSSSVDTYNDSVSIHSDTMRRRASLASANAASVNVDAAAMWALRVDVMGDEAGIKAGGRDAMDEGGGVRSGAGGASGGGGEVGGVGGGANISSSSMSVAISSSTSKRRPRRRVTLVVSPRDGASCGAPADRRRWREAESPGSAGMRMDARAADAEEDSWLGVGVEGALVEPRLADRVRREARGTELEPLRNSEARRVASLSRDMRSVDVVKRRRVVAPDDAAVVGTR
mmetsp:Transcript_13798/g.43442  ORF Transcript_13798/g.43442 Transcript_13798/m.43442 type:complete len:335 (-) Transcript_13798:398-1402(-)